MNHVVIILDIEDAGWSDLRKVEAEGKLIHLNKATSFAIAGVANGMVSGKPSVMIRVDLPEGKVLLLETSLALILSAADALRIRHGDPRKDQGLGSS